MLSRPARSGFNLWSRDRLGTGFGTAFGPAPKGLVVAAEPQRVRRARRRQGAVAVRGQVIAEQLARRIIVLADDHRGDLFDVGQHDHLSGTRITISPASEVEPVSLEAVLGVLLG